MSEKHESRARRPGAQAVGSTVAAEVLRLIEVADLDAGLDRHTQALERLHQARSVDPGLRPEVRFAIDRRIAACLERLGRAEEAQRVARAALEAAPVDVDPQERARCLLSAGKAAFEQGQFTTARAEARAVLETLGEDSLCEEIGLARRLLGGIAYRSGEPEVARDQFERSLEIFRKLGNLHYLAGSYVNLGNLYKLRCDWERAAEHYQVAYHLSTTLGEHDVVVPAAQNLGVLLSKTGRLGEARTHLERALKLSLEMGDSVRAARARLALSQLERSEERPARARSLIGTFYRSDSVVLPERERCLLLLEETRLDIENGDLDAATRRAAELRLRVEAMAPRGDLMVEVLLLEADMAREVGSWEEVQRTAEEARDLSRADRDRAQEERALLRLAISWAHTGRTGEATAALQGLAERQRVRSEWPALAATLAAHGRVLRDVLGDAEGALPIFNLAADHYRKLDMRRRENLMEAERIRCIIRAGRHDEAVARVDALRRSESDSEPFPSLERVLEAIEQDLRRLPSVEAIQGPDGLQVHERLEEVLVAPGSPWERLREVLTILRDALEVDDALLARCQGEDLDILARVGFDALGERTVVPATVLGLSAKTMGEASLQRDREGTGLPRFGSRLTIPMAIRGRPHLVCLQRGPATGRSPLGRAESNYTMVLTAEIVRALDRGSPEAEMASVAGGIALADVITQDPAMLRILDLVRRIGDTGLSVLLQGETGTGKKLLANAIHRASGRRDRGFVTVDCAALPETLLEAELFGYRKGAFTGATQDRTGLLAEAAGGTVFLDEIDKAGLTVQRRFLHLLDSGEIRPVGSTSYVRLDLRIVCATSCPDLRREVAEGRFLKDLYYRLNDISIQIPSLAERRGDILLLAGCFIETFAGQAGRRIRGMSNGFRRAVLAHDWPGNVRELEKAIRRAVTLADDDVVLTPDLLPVEVLESSRSKDAREDQDEDDRLRRGVEVFERRAIERALEACGGNKSRAAILLGLSRKGLRGKIARYSIGKPASTGG